MQSLPADAIKAAQEVIKKRKGDPAKLVELADTLLDSNEITYAGQVLTVAERLYTERDSLWFTISKKLALCTYKDQDQPLSDRLAAAETRLKELLKRSDLPLKEQQDVLGMLGGISKQRWRAFGSRLHLEASVSSYQEGARRGGIPLDGGYTALNAAFGLDALADLERDDDGKLSAGAIKRRAEASDLRVKILEQVPSEPDTDAPTDAKWWRYCTLGESLLGLHRYDEASSTLKKAAALKVDNWRREAAARQMADVVRLHRPGDDTAIVEGKAWIAVANLLDGSVEAVRLLVGGKVGLALSGGGFRASLFHIGVLARLAELDVLRHVEVISCVSGGSIVGAYYYLKLQQLLERLEDGCVTRDHYIRLVRQIETEFLGGVQRNLRNLMLFGFKSNWKVLTSRQSSMTHRLGDLYERELYSRIEDGRNQQPRLLGALRVKPKKQETFIPKSDNWKRRAKVPILVLNATTLNTCHNWQFTATFMGEPPTRSVNTGINANDRLRRMYHHEAPLAFRKTPLRLGHAVAASACVPGLFDPLVLDDLYKDGYVTRLVDGGVFDNQGVASLLEQDCTMLLISDASGQTGKELEPADTRMGVMTRTQDVLMARVRESQYELLNTLSGSSLLRGVMYLHLKRDLNPQQVDWLRCPNPTAPGAVEPRTSYKIRRDVQERLAGLRTDLDAFSEVEADALMLSGYLMASEQFESISGIPTSTEDPERWRFQRIQEIVCAEQDTEHLDDVLRALKVGERLAFKPFFMSRVLSTGAALLLLGALVSLLYWVWSSWTTPLVLAIDRTHMVAAVVALPALILVGAGLRWIARHFRYRNRPQRVLFAAGICLLFGWAVMKLYSAVTQSFFLRSRRFYPANDYRKEDLEIPLEPAAPSA